MFRINKQICTFFCAIVPMVLLSCAEKPYYGNKQVGVGLRDHSDAVLNINQVDPEYRKYFIDQHDANFSVAAQREAFMAAVQTSKTPVQQDAAHMARNAQKGKKITSKNKSSKSSKKKVVKSSSSKKKASTSSKKKPTPAKKTSSKSKKKR